MYRFQNVKAVQLKRWKNLTHPKWVEAMELLICNEQKKSEGMWFRWHDSGDVRNGEHLLNIFSLAYRIPSVNFWLPYRIPTEPDGVRKMRVQDLLKACHEYYGVPENLTIRFSSERFGELDSLPKEISSTPELDMFSMVLNPGITGQEGIYECPATGADGTGECGDCRACWSRDVRVVAYHRH